jgi:hypothetical protein
MTKKTKSGMRRDGRQSSQSKGDHKKAQRWAETQMKLLAKKREAQSEAKQ